AEYLWKIVDGALHEATDFSLSDGALRIAIRGHQRKLNNMCFILGFGIKRRQLDRRSLPPQSSQRFVQRDPCEPGGQARIAAELAEVGEGTEIGLLNHILRLAVITSDGAGDAVQTPVVPSHDDAKGA